MVTQSKQTYINRWNEAINELKLLGFCPNRDLSQRVFNCIGQLKELVNQVADTKQFAEV